MSRSVDAAPTTTRAAPQEQKVNETKRSEERIEEISRGTGIDGQQLLAPGTETARNAALMSAAPKSTDNTAGTATPAVSQEQSADMKEALLKTQELLGKSNELLGKSNGTCNNSCHCAIA